MTPAEAAEVPDREGQDRGRHRSRQDQGLEAGSGHDRGRVAGELVGLVAGVVADDDRSRLRRARGGSRRARPPPG